LQYNKILKKKDILIADGLDNVIKILDGLKMKIQELQISDILSCAGGCIGPGMIDKYTIAQRIKRVKGYGILHQDMKEI
jgi:iron only hydrogenase large subunit-like protein